MSKPDERTKKLIQRDQRITELERDLEVVKSDRERLHDMNNELRTRVADLERDISEVKIANMVDLERDLSEVKIANMAMADLERGISEGKRGPGRPKKDE